MGCGISMIKYLLFFFNLIFALCGLAILAVGVVFKLRLEEVMQMLDDFNINVAPILFIVVGSIVFVIAFFGCCGAIRESHCMTVTYAVFLIIILIVQVAIAILVFVYIDDVNKAFQTAFEKLFAQNTNEDSRDTIFALQTQFECCGKTGPLSWGSIALDKSCCATTASVCSPANAFQTGCVEAIMQAIDSASKTIGAVALGIAAVEVVGAIFALCLANSIRNQDRRFGY